jgi:hypothetical protein
VGIFIKLIQSPQAKIKPAVEKHLETGNSLLQKPRTIQLQTAITRPLLVYHPDNELTGLVLLLRPTDNTNIIRKNMWIIQYRFGRKQPIFPEFHLHCDPNR